MKLIMVRCTSLHDTDDDEPRIGVTNAPGPSEAEDMCRTAYSAKGYTAFQTADVIEGHFAGLLRVLGFTGQQPAFSWKP
jgi:hypothetical protein